MNDKSNVASNPSNEAPPWWRFGYVWLVIAGPAVVIVAGFITLYLAISRPDPVLSPDSLVPAMKARNHAATGGIASEKPAKPLP